METFLNFLKLKECLYICPRSFCLLIRIMLLYPIWSLSPGLLVIVGSLVIMCLKRRKFCKKQQKKTETTSPELFSSNPLCITWAFKLSLLYAVKKKKYPLVIFLNIIGEDFPKDKHVISCRLRQALPLVYSLTFSLTHLSA